MPNDRKIKSSMKRQIVKFLDEHLHILNNPQTLANRMQEKFPNDKITRQYIDAQLRQPSLTFILWLADEYKLNIDWVLKGEKDKSTQMIKV